jgi:hypothetical protein
VGPTLKPGDIVICDDLPAHKAANGTVDKLWWSLGLILDQIQADGCQNSFKNSGYASNSNKCSNSRRKAFSGMSFNIIAYRAGMLLNSQSNRKLFFNPSFTVLLAK